MYAIAIFKIRFFFFFFGKLEIALTETTGKHV